MLWDAATGTAHGVRNRCPHSGAPLCLGACASARRASRASTSSPESVSCAARGTAGSSTSESGACLDDPALRAAVYPVEIADGVVRIRA